MTELQTFSPRLIEAWLAANQFTHGTSEEGYVVPFGADGPGQPDMLLVISAEGTTGEILVVRSVFDRQYPVSRHVEMQALADEWNRKFRFPKAVTGVEDDVTAVFGELQIDLGGGTFPAQVARQLGIGLATASGLRQWITEQTAEWDVPLLDESDIDAALARLLAGEYDDPPAAA